MAYIQTTKQLWRRRAGPISEKIYDEFKLVKTEYDATQASASTNATSITTKIEAGTGSTGYAMDKGGPATCSSNILTVSFNVTYAAAPTVVVQSADTSSITTAATVTTASFVASSSGASNVFNWMAYGA
jgi:hypothetical protein